MWFAPFRRAGAVQRDAAGWRVCDLHNCPRTQPAGTAKSGDRRSFRTEAISQYVLNDTVQCACRRPLLRGFLV